MQREIALSIELRFASEPGQLESYSPKMPSFPTIRTEIAGLPVADLARQFGTPTVCLRRRQDRRTDRGPAAIRRDSLRPKGQLESGDPRSHSPQRGPGRCRERGRSPAGLGRRLPCRTATRRRSSIRPISSIANRSIWLSDLGLHVNCGSPDMIDQLGERAPGSRITLRINPGLRPRP